MNREAFAANFKRPRMGRRLTALIISLTVMGMCIAVFKIVGFGTDPSSTFGTGLSNWTGVSFGTCMLVFNLLMFVPVIRCDLSRIGIGTVLNMAGVGYIADFFQYVFREFVPENGLSMAVRLALFAASMALFLVAVSFYMVVDLGIAPYDAIPQLIAARAGKLGFRYVRMIWDLSILSIGFLLGAAVGLTTLVTGFCLGPAVSAVSGRVRGWFGE